MLNGLFDLIITFLQLHPSLKVVVGPKESAGLVSEIFLSLFELPETVQHKVKIIIFGKF